MGRLPPSADPLALALSVLFGTVGAVMWVDGAALTVGAAVSLSALLGATGIVTRRAYRHAEQRGARLGDYALVLLTSVFVAGTVFGVTMAAFDGDATDPLDSLWRGSLFGVTLGALRVWHLRQARKRPRLWT